MRLNPAQKGIWAGHLLSEDKSLYNTAECIFFSGKINSDLLTKSIQQVVLECDALSCYYRTSDDLEGHTVEEKLPVTVKRQALPDNALSHDYVRTWAEASDLHRPFDLAHELPCRFTIFNSREQDALYLCVHHIALDGYGYLLFLQRLAEVYTAMLKGLAAPAANFGSLNDTFEDTQSESTDDKSRNFWLERLAGTEEPAALMPIDGALKPGYHRVKADIPSDTCLSLQSYAKTSKSNWIELSTAAFALLLSAKTGTKRPSFGIPMMNRMGSKSARVPCMNMNLVPVIFSLEESDTLASVAAKISNEKKALRPHQTYRYEDMQRDQQKIQKRQRLFGPVVNVLPFGRDLVFGGCTGKKDIISSGPVVDVTLSIFMGSSTEAPTLEFSCNKTAGSQRALELLKDDFFLLLNNAIESTDRPIALVLKASKARACELSLLGQMPSVPVDSDVLQMIRAAAARFPRKAAIVSIDHSVSYAELIVRVEEWSGSLKERGVKPGDYVGVMLDRSIEAVIAVLAILNAGATYVPLDRLQPEKRQSFILSTLGLKFLIVSEKHTLPSTLNSESINLIRPFELNGGTRFSQTDEMRDQAYVMFTSGSTGRPKGVSISMHALSAFVVAAIERYKIKSDDTILQFAPFHFDTSIEEIFIALASGSILALRTDRMLQSFQDFLVQVETFGCTVLDLPTAYWNEWVEALALGAATLPRGVKTIILGGEAVQQAKLQKWFKADAWKIDLINSYGPTETTVVVSTTKLTSTHCDLDYIPIGTPISGVQFLVVDQSGWPADEGELLISGATLGSHYLGYEGALRTEVAVGKKEQSFYRTGDHVRRQGDEILFLGRIDSEIKISGQRIQPQEVESQLLVIPGVSEACVIGVKHDFRNRLTAFVVLTGDTDKDAVRTQLSQNLPPAMRPHLKVLDALPKNSAGKLDRVALSATAVADISSAQPEKELDQSVLTRIKQIWRSELAVEDIDNKDSFFSVGGQSLQAIQLAWRLSKEFGREIHVADIFQHPVLADFACFIREKILTEKGNAQIFRITDLPAVAQKRIFAIPGIFGSSAQFLDLAFHLRAKAKIGVIELAADGGQLLEETLTFSQLAVSYANVIDTQDEDEELIVLGHSFGGVLALEVSDILKQRGRKVRCVTLDCYLSSDAHSLRFDLFIGNMKDLLGPKDEKYLINAGNTKVAEAQLSLLAAYKPQKPYSVDILRIYAKDNRRDAKVRETMIRDHDVFGSSSNLHEVDGNHYTMLTGPGAAAIGERLLKWI